MIIFGRCKDVDVRLCWTCIQNRITRERVQIDQEFIDGTTCIGVATKPIICQREYDGPELT